jgi:hypothetical protein
MRRFYTVKIRHYYEWHFEMYILAYVQESTSHQHLGFKGTMI